jgi:hypothetical protein
MGIYGQDWASYQSATPPTNGLSFAFTKVTEGLSYVNPQWVSQRNTAKGAGLVWGGYHYPHMGNSVQAEANYFLGQVAWKPGDMAVLDWEGYDSANAGVSKTDQAKYKDAWLKYVKSKLPHNPVGLYANTDYWTNVDTTSFYQDFLWIATAGLPAGQPGIQSKWLFHQYAAKSIDQDYCSLASTKALQDWTLSFQSTPAPAPSQPPTSSGGTVPSSTAEQVWAYRNGQSVQAYNMLVSLWNATTQPTIKSQIDGAMHTLGEHTAATNAWVAQIAKDVTAIKKKLGI